MDHNILLNITLRLHKEEQHQSIIQLLEILLESPNGLIQPDNQVHSREQASLYFYFGDSLFKGKYFRRSYRAYEQALLLKFDDSGCRRSSKRSKTTLNSSIIDSKSNSVSFDDNELKYRMSLCKIEMHENVEARRILEQIPHVERSVKILSTLASLYCQEKIFIKARDTYMDVLRKEPFSFDAVIKLCKLCKLGKVSYEDILKFITDDTKPMGHWYPTWIQAQFCLHSADSKTSIRLFNSLTSRLEKNASILTHLAQAHYQEGNYDEAIRIFKIAYNSDPLCFSRVDSYAACLHKESQHRQLEDLSLIMGARCSIEGEYFHEPWLVLAHYYASKDKKEPRALLFVQKAYQLNRNSLEVLILLASLFIEKKDPAKATGYILAAYNQAPYRYEILRLVCDAYLASNKKSMALAYAKTAITDLSESPRSYFIYADVIIKSNDQRRRSSARTYLEKSIALDPNYLPSVLALADILIEDKKGDKAIEILKNARQQHPTHRGLNARLYHCYITIEDFDDALDYEVFTSKDFERIKNIVESPREEVEPASGFEADELVDGESEVDESNLD